MKKFLSVLLLALPLTALAQHYPLPHPRPHPYPYPQPHPYPQSYQCDAVMLDCYNRPVYRSWGRSNSYQHACSLAMRVCRDNLWHGGPGARCVITGRGY